MELKKAEDIINSKRAEKFTEEYRKGFKTALIVAYKKAMKLSVDADVVEEEYDLQKMKSISNKIH